MEIDLRVRRPRHVRPILDPLEQFDEVELHERFRFDSESIAYITELIRPSLTWPFRLGKSFKIALILIHFQAVL